MLETPHSSGDVDKTMRMMIDPKAKSALALRDLASKKRFYYPDQYNFGELMNYIYRPKLKNAWEMPMAGLEQ